MDCEAGTDSGVTLPLQQREFCCCTLCAQGRGRAAEQPLCPKRVPGACRLCLRALRDTMQHRGTMSASKCGHKATAAQCAAGQRGCENSSITRENPAKPARSTINKPSPDARWGVKGSKGEWDGGEKRGVPQGQSAGKKSGYLNFSAFLRTENQHSTSHTATQINAAAE